MSHVQHQHIVPGPKMDVYRLVTDPSGLEDQLKNHIHVKWQNPGVELKAGSEFLFLMERFGVAQPVRFRVEKMVLGNSFSYQQIEGFFAHWSHTIKFEDHGQGETLVTDLIDYEMPFGLLGRVVDDFWWREDLKHVLKARFEIIAKKVTAGDENSVLA